MLLKCYNQSVDVFRPTEGSSTVDDVTYVKTTVNNVHIGSPSYAMAIIGQNYASSIGGTQNNAYAIFHRKGISTDFDFAIGDIICEPSTETVPLNRFGTVVAVNPRMSGGRFHHTEIQVL